jgi:hypothetical protein
MRRGDVLRTLDTLSRYPESEHPPTRVRYHASRRLRGHPIGAVPPARDRTHPAFAGDVRADSLPAARCALRGATECRTAIADDPCRASGDGGRGRLRYSSFFSDTRRLRFGARSNWRLGARHGHSVRVMRTLASSATASLNSRSAEAPATVTSLRCSLTSAGQRHVAPRTGSSLAARIGHGRRRPSPRGGSGYRSAASTPASGSRSRGDPPRTS